MARSRNRQVKPTGTVARAEPKPLPKSKRIGIIGKANLSSYEEASLQFIGKCLAKLGHELVIVPAPGTATAVRVGVELQGGSVKTLDAGVLSVADRTLLYPDPRLTERLEQTNPDIHQRDDVVFIKESELDEWVDAMKSILTDHGIPRP